MLWACSPGVLNPSGTFNPSFPSSVKFPTLHLVFGLYLLPHAVGRSLSDDNWTRSQCMSIENIMNIIRNHIFEGFLICFGFLPVLFSYTLHIKAFHLLVLSHPGIVGHGLPLIA